MLWHQRGITAMLLLRLRVARMKCPCTSMPNGKRILHLLRVRSCLRWAAVESEGVTESLCSLLLRSSSPSLVLLLFCLLLLLFSTSYLPLSLSSLCSPHALLMIFLSSFLFMFVLAHMQSVIMFTSSRAHFFSRSFFPLCAGNFVPTVMLVLVFVLVLIFIPPSNFLLILIFALIIILIFIPESLFLSLRLSGSTSSLTRALTLILTLTPNSQSHFNFPSRSSVSLSTLFPLSLRSGSNLAPRGRIFLALTGRPERTLSH